jgi:transcriptional regulator with XRE-family HTH domain
MMNVRAISRQPRAKPPFEYGQRLLEERKRLGLSQDRLASLGRVAKRTYCHYESGLREPGAAFLEAMAGAGVDVLYLLTGMRHGSERRARSEATDLGTMPASRSGHARTPP